MSQRWFPNSMPNPMVDFHTLPWWTAAARHQLQVQCCDLCGHGQLPPTPICSECRSMDLSMKDVSGKELSLKDVKKILNAMVQQLMRKKKWFFENDL